MLFRSPLFYPFLPSWFCYSIFSKQNILNLYFLSYHNYLPISTKFHAYSILGNPKPWHNRTGTPALPAHVPAFSYNNAHQSPIAVIDNLLHGILQFHLAFIIHHGNLAADAVLHQFPDGFPENIGLPNPFFLFP